MTVNQSNREEKGQTIAQHSGQIQRVDDYLYVVKSQSHNGEYAVHKVDNEWNCECPDNTYRHIPCKHIHAVVFSQRIREEVAVQHIEPLDNITECIYCGSQNLMRAGKRKNKAGTIQKYLCHDCHKYFTFNIGFERMKHNPQAVTTAMQLYFSGVSLRNTMKALELTGVKVSYRTILNWIKKYTRLMRDYAEKLKPNVSDIWRADELYLTMGKDLKYLFAVIDDETRYWISQEVAETKEKHDARALFFRAKRLMGKEPKTLITDGLPSYSAACEQAFDKTQHIRKIAFDGKVHNNNKMERFNGTVRDREKTMRGLKRKRTPILEGMQVYYNFVRPHMALNGKTPSEACGIKVEGENKWLTLIQNASKAKANSND